MKNLRPYYFISALAALLAAVAFWYYTRKKKEGYTEAQAWPANIQSTEDAQIFALPPGTRYTDNADPYTLPYQTPTSTPAPMPAPAPATPYTPPYQTPTSTPAPTPPIPYPGTPTAGGSQPTTQSSTTF